MRWSRTDVWREQNGCKTDILRTKVFLDTGKQAARICYRNSPPCHKKPNFQIYIERPSQGKFFHIPGVDFASQRHEPATHCAWRQSLPGWDVTIRATRYLSSKLSQQMSNFRWLHLNDAYTCHVRGIFIEIWNMSLDVFNNIFSPRCHGISLEFALLLCQISSIPNTFKLKQSLKYTCETFHHVSLDPTSSTLATHQLHSQTNQWKILLFMRTVDEISHRHVYQMVAPSILPSSES